MFKIYTRNRCKPPGYAQNLLRAIQIVVFIIAAPQLITAQETSNRRGIISIHGKITNDNGGPLVGAIVRTKQSNKRAVTNTDGEFRIADAASGEMLLISFIGYKNKEFSASPEMATIQLELAANELSEVAVYSNGYQNIPKERATGSFILIDSALLNRKVSSNILERLDGITSGLIFNHNLAPGANNADITIRGRSTIFANPNPLIVLDNFPYDGDINNINPNDVENISILKDAAAASIWGVRAGNGVIVITTKKGTVGASPTLTMTANITGFEKPDLEYVEWIPSDKYIDLEKFLFDKGYFDNTLSNKYSAISPAVALMDKFKRGQISTSDYNSSINLLKQVDVRDDMSRYLYRNEIKQQYNLNISGGSPTQKYFISGGYDRNLPNQVSNSYNRYTLTANNTVKLFSDRFEVFNSILFSKSSTNTNNTTNNYSPLSPYQQLADLNGNPLAVTNANTLRASYVDTAGNGKLLDWRYIPLNELGSNRTVDLVNYRLTTTASYRIVDPLRFLLTYQYERGVKSDKINNSPASFYSRNLINQFSSISSSTGAVTRVIPIGNINNENQTSSSSQYLRAQISFDKVIHENHRINAVAGYEFKDYKDDLASQLYYGVDPLTRTNANGLINSLTNYRLYYNPSNTQTISTSPYQLGNIDRSVSYFANASYDYKQKYILSLSGRKDETNIFGVKSNQKGVPLWSAGLAWNISNESFYKFEQLSYLKFRVTYGYNGNVDKSTSAYLTSQFSGTSVYGIDYARVINPPNPGLSWERISNINLGADFATKGNRFTGSLEYYIKHGTDLIGESPIAPQTGVSVFKGNSANTKTSGIDFSLNIQAINNIRFKWIINTFYNYSNDKITTYKRTPAINGDLVFSNYGNPLAGYPYYSIFAFKSSGLDEKGDPIGSVNGESSKAYSTIYNSSNRDDIIYFGSATPTSFGSVRNSFNLDQWSVSLNLVYKLGYYFRRSNVFSGSTYSYNQSSYADRWQAPGDELRTTVPSLVYPVDSYRGILYQGSQFLVEKGDHLRLQDIKLNYALNNPFKLKNPVKSIQVFAYMNNVGILWRANKMNLDPDAGSTTVPISRSLSIGLNATF